MYKLRNKIYSCHRHRDIFSLGLTVNDWAGAEIVWVESRVHGSGHEHQFQVLELRQAVFEHREQEVCEAVPLVHFVYQDCNDRDGTSHE